MMRVALIREVIILFKIAGVVAVRKALRGVASHSSDDLTLDS